MNSVHEKVTVNSAFSKNWVGCTVRTSKAQAACALLPGHAHAARWAPCGGALGAVSWPPSYHVTACIGRVAGCVVLHDVDLGSIYKICIATQFPAALTTRHTTRGTARVVALLRHVTGRWAPCHSSCLDTKAALRHDTKLCIVTLPVA